MRSARRGRRCADGARADALTLEGAVHWRRGAVRGPRGMLGGAGPRSLQWSLRPTASRRDMIGGAGLRGSRSATLSGGNGRAPAG